MSRQAIQTDLAPSVIGHYSPAIKVGKTLYLSGQIPLDPKTGMLVEGDIQRHVDQVFMNIKAVVEAANYSMDEVVKLTVYLMDLSAISAVNTAVERFFTVPYPARTSIQVAGLPKGCMVEIEAIVMKE